MYRGKGRVKRGGKGRMNLNVWRGKDNNRKKEKYWKAQRIEETSRNAWTVIERRIEKKGGQEVGRKGRIALGLLHSLLQAHLSNTCTASLAPVRSGGRAQRWFASTYLGKTGQVRWTLISVMWLVIVFGFFKIFIEFAYFVCYLRPVGQGIMDKVHST